jgi:hypothetical protein
MKQTLKLTLFGAMAALALCASGCDTPKSIYNAGTYTTSAKTADQIIADAEIGTEVGLDVINSFVHQEKDYRELFAKLGPKPHELSVWLRERVADPYDIDPEGARPPTHFVPRGQAMLASTRIATETFKANRTPANEANLRTAWAALQTVITNCKKFTTSATGKK